MAKVSYFSPGPSKLPDEVLKKVQDELLCYRNTHVSMLELSHRTKDFLEILERTKELVRILYKVPENYKIIFSQGGGMGQFAAVPLNLIGKTGKADYVVTGTWSSTAAKEATKYGEVNYVVPQVEKFTGIAHKEEWKLGTGSSYVYYCSNETIEGIEYQYLPDVGNVPLVCDMSSNFFSRPVDVSKYGVIYGGAQKNIGCPGVALVIVREDLLNFALPICPSVFHYATFVKNNSVVNTPPTFAIYVMMEVLEWIHRNGGLEAMEKNSIEKSSMLYDMIDQSSGYYASYISADARSRMNVPFRIGGLQGNEPLEDKFVKEAAEEGMLSLKGHRSVGGLRASLYNALTVEDVKRLVDFMRKFAQKNPLEK